MKEKEVFADAVATDDTAEPSAPGGFQLDEASAPEVADTSAVSEDQAEAEMVDKAEPAEEATEPADEKAELAATSEPADTALHEQLASRDDEIMQLRKELKDAISARNDVADAHADWLKEREELKGQKEELEQLLAQERERADSAEERIRDLRRTNEESRRAIMRLQQARPSTPRTDSDTSERSARRTSAILGPFTAKTLSSAMEGDAEPEHKGLRDLQLVSPPQAHTDSFSPVLGSKIEEEHKEEEAEPAPVPKDGAEEGSQQTGLTGLFPSSLLRPPFHLLRKSGGTESQTSPTLGTQDDGAALESLRTEHEKAQTQLASMHKEVLALQDQLLESREAQQASESLIKSLREYIVNAEKSGKREVPAPPASAAEVAIETVTSEAPAAPTADITESVAATDASPPLST